MDFESDKSSKTKPLVSCLFFRCWSRWTLYAVDPYFMLQVAEKHDVKFSTVEAAMEEISVSASNTATWLFKNIDADKILITGAAYKDDILISDAARLLTINNLK